MRKISYGIILRVTMHKIAGFKSFRVISNHLLRMRWQRYHSRCSAYPFAPILILSCRNWLYHFETSVDPDQLASSEAS